ncbi:hypothetical protein K1F50_18765 [Muricauda oceani]|uniref:Uncharacterized protein n=1 Tax=Flagellimonas oceani TaxID=2698672 RepID=A0A6G7IZ00_9FLAO|nr:hypothetical protein [Allomuricauda oceani]MBW8244857.1 hypothetical protein [Allomuricauda oceani]QII43833.1 hypothetical protein GVT53_03795 [Allomuricauda oceani]
METKTKRSSTNGKTVKQNATVKTVKDKLTQEAMASTVNGKDVPDREKPTINLDDRIQRFEKLRGLATNRERLTSTLNELTKFNYNQGDSCSFFIRDSHGLEFKTTNSNLIKLVTEHLQLTLQARKTELEKEIIEFQL